MKNTYFIILFFFILVAGKLRTQCWPEGFTHDTRPSEMWLSCTQTMSPNPDREEGLWLMYDFGETYGLSTTTIWNYNEPGMLELGVTQVAIDYSLDGQNWTSWGTQNLSLATGRRDYPGEAGPDLTGISARYVLITVLQTGAGNTCAGLSEIRFDLDGTVSVIDLAQEDLLEAYPNPTKDFVQLRLPGKLLSTVEIYDQQGRLLNRAFPQRESIRLDLANLPSGIYMLRALDGDGLLHRRKLTVL
ncbi:MAG: T9SS type A sorting domain-containing protein [Bacteroidota bacterium]